MSLFLSPRVMHIERNAQMLLIRGRGKSEGRQERLFQEDIRTFGGAYDLAKIDLLLEFAPLNAGSLLNYSSFARTIRASVESIQLWMPLLKQLSFCFTLRPWRGNISRFIAKEPKVFVIDWSGVSDPGKRNENFVASSLLKAAEGWNDSGLGDYALHYISTKEKREVDFVVTVEKAPWILIEVETSDTHLSSQLT